MDFYTLGATLYIPGNNKQLVDVANKKKIHDLKSLVICTEDTISEHELPQTLDHINESLYQFHEANLYRFIRPRNPSVLEKILQMPAIHNVHGFVLPKVTMDNLKMYFSLLTSNDPFKIMIILETAHVFNHHYMYKMRDMLTNPFYKERILAIRIGGLDMLNILGLRRSADNTIYDTPVGQCICQLITIFKPAGFNLCAPAYEYLENVNILRKEVEMDIQYGLFAKTAIHPNQIETIQSMYKVCKKELETAHAILDPSYPAVFRMHDSMCEKAIHWNWALGIIERYKHYGIAEEYVEDNFYEDRDRDYSGTKS